MDDYLESSPTVEEASNKAKDLVTMLAKGGFNLTKFVSNIGHLPAELQRSGKSAPADAKVIPKSDESSHVLGLKWIMSLIPS